MYPEEKKKILNEKNADDDGMQMNEDYMHSTTEEKNGHDRLHHIFGVVRLNKG